MFTILKKKQTRRICRRTYSCGIFSLIKNMCLKKRMKDNVGSEKFQFSCMFLISCFLHAKDTHFILTVINVNISA